MTLIPKYRVEWRERRWNRATGKWEQVPDGSMAWKRAYGPASVANLERWVRKYEESTRPGGHNQQLGERQVAEAALIHQRTGAEVCRWTAPTFYL